MTGVKNAVMLHLRNGADVNATDDKGRSALILAADKGHSEICQILLEAGADPALCDDNGNDALSMAIIHGRKDIEDILRPHLAPLKPEMFQEVATAKGALPFHHEIIPFSEGASISNNVGETVFNGDDFDLSLWEEEKETLKPLEDASCLADARTIQAQISRHVPIDTDEDWSDVDIDLPELLAFRSQQAWEEDAAWQVAARRLLLGGIRDGWITEDQLIKAIPPDEKNLNIPSENHLNALRIVLGDLGIQVEDSLGAFAIWPEPEVGGGEGNDIFNDRIEQTADEAIVFLSDLHSYINDPLTQYAKDIGPKKVLLRDEEIRLAHEISEGFKEALGSIPRSPSAMAELLNWLERAERGDISIRTLIGDGGDMGEDAPVQEGPQAFANDEYGDEEFDKCLTTVSLESPPASEIPTDVHLKFKTIRNLHDAMTTIQSILEREASANKLRDEIHELGISCKFREQLLKRVSADSSSHNAQAILARGLRRVQAARNKFATFNLRLVLWVARKYRGLPLMDLVQEGNLGLLKAIDRFDPSYGTRFSTYAIWWIRQAITRSIADTRRTIRLPVHLVDGVRKVELASKSLKDLLGRKPTVTELASTTDLPESLILRILNVPHDPLPITDIPDLDLSLDESVVDLVMPSPEDAMEQTLLKKAVKEAIGGLTEREAQIIKLRFGFNKYGDHTLEEIGSLYGLTRERIRQIEVKALRKLRHPVRSLILKPFWESA